jgi:hypothetical protein
MKNLSHLIQGYLGNQPQDKECVSWVDFESKMEEEINEHFKDEIYLHSEMDFIEQALNNYWNMAHYRLENHPLGDIERKHLEFQLQKSKQILERMNRL